MANTVIGAYGGNIGVRWWIGENRKLRSGRAIILVCRRELDL